MTFETRSGTKRFGKLWQAARDQEPAPPVDLRFLKRPCGKIGSDEQSQVRGDVCSFLEYIYESVAETLPDFRDELGSTTDVTVNVEDPYSVELQSESRKRPLEDLENVDLRPKSKPRKRKGQIEINQSRTSAVREERWLPPSSMKEYWEQYRIQSALPKAASFPTFWRAPGTSD